MSRVTPAKFDILSTPLEGVNLIEASAGTGKTYAIAGLFLRLLLEKRLTPGEILVVTFTVAATEELKERIRRLIRSAIDAFSNGHSDDAFLSGLVQNVHRSFAHTGGSEDERELKLHECMGSVQILRRALRNFDEASIYTIHGFCRRVLQEHAFECGGFFDAEVLPDESDLMEEIVRDFWRKHFYEAPPELVSYASTRGYTVQKFIKIIRNRLSDPFMKIVPSLSPVSLTSLEHFRQAYTRVRSHWCKVRDEILALFLNPIMDRRFYKNPHNLITRMDSYLSSGITFPLFDGFDKFTTGGLRTIKGKTPPSHTFFDLCEELKITAEALTEEIERYLLYLEGEIFRYGRDEIKKRKESRHQLSFDDLIVKVYESLTRLDAHGDTLIKALRARYKAGLIDEFQDTDQLQYAIFQHIFGGGNATLFLIGDPKQSIYSFRGADLFTYIRASQGIRRRYTLAHNWRSEPDLIRAVNTLFENVSGDTFLSPEISFEKVTSVDVSSRENLVIKGPPEAALHIWFVSENCLEQEGAKHNVELTAKCISRAVAAEIVRLLNEGKRGNILIGSQPLSPGHIAVLVRKNNEARFIQEMLSSLGVPSVRHGTDNLFDSDEALELERILLAIVNPRDSSSVRTAFSTNIIGLTGEEIDHLIQPGHEAQWEKWIDRLELYKNLWETHGFIVMFRSFLTQERVKEKLLAFSGGERRLTNVLHLMEVLHSEAMKRKLGMTGLIKWLSRQRNSSSVRSEEHELRLESDALAVKIVTIHKSKGLEYPIVFCPFNWGDSKIEDDEPFIFHHPENEWESYCVLRAENDFQKRMGEREKLAENIRLLYVSLTRAKNRCYLVWGPLKGAATSALAYVLHPPAGECPDIVTEIENRFERMSETEMRKDLETLASKSGGTVSVYDIPFHAPEPYAPIAKNKSKTLSGLTFGGNIDRTSRIASFSSLIIYHDESLPFPYEDVSDTPWYENTSDVSKEVYDRTYRDIFSFPRGAKTGSFFHDILKQVDFAALDDTVVKKIVQDKLIQYGFEREWEETICHVVNNLAYAPLSSNGLEVQLKKINKEDLIAEFEFYYPLKHLTPEILERTFCESGVPFTSSFSRRLGRLKFAPQCGFMKGFIDLVVSSNGRFFLVDWKTNYLGDSLAQYSSDVLREIMQEELYVLQYYLYTMALHQYLKRRLIHYDYEKNFGGVFYLFLRGIDASNNYATGIYYDKPPKTVIEFLCDALIPS